MIKIIVWHKGCPKKLEGKNQVVYSTQDNKGTVNVKESKILLMKMKDGNLSSGFYRAMVDSNSGEIQGSWHLTDGQDITGKVSRWAYL